MKTITVLGPKGTYSDIAAKKYLDIINDNYNIEYYPSIIKSLKAIDQNKISIAPFENALDGFITETLDQIIAENLNIKYQIKLPINFVFVSNNLNIDNVKNVYVQFKAYGQCLNFISNNKFNCIKTESNIESLNNLIEKGEDYGAIIPIHAVSFYNFKNIIMNVSDEVNNETRFFVLDKGKLNDINDDFEASLVFTSVSDKPGILFSILKEFNDRNINLKSILSRPSHKALGSYNFYVECKMKKNEKNNFFDLIECFKSDSDYKVRILGIYNILGK